MSPDFWAGFATCAVIVALILVSAALRMAGLCSTEERRHELRMGRDLEHDPRLN